MAENRVNPQNFYVVQGWMVSGLGLKGNELAVYAIIYGFSQAEQQYYTGSAQYLADWIKSTKKTALAALKSLVEKGCIEKRERLENGVKFCDYRCKNYTTLEKNLHHPREKITPPLGKKLHHPSVKISPHNIADKIEDNIADTDTEKAPVLSAAKHLGYIFCEVFGAESISKRLLTSMDETLQAGVTEKRIESMIRSAKNKHPREPESYIAAGLKKLRETAPQEQPVSFKPEEKPLEPWEQDWLREFQSMQKQQTS
ncbi:helix-turn-helix domain-containing protein [Butyricicoccus intestinisimiae]|uniref:Helix-turn-helix domain-containing protein n=1 Tax=Butyricicoccus intestinisimiae TaxID=2841509 RepID=A0ABS6EQ25_9FIRM|nr:helix-turn-helix domain-containing protein [Butyricicoccus intestinisimiae]MBU5489797.1 helix-turn-helix domain-containing protein [Butyricicoccus intestinisimiae]